MKLEKEFRQYLSDKGLSKRVVSDYISRCRRVERDNQCDLYERFSTTQCEILCELLLHNSDINGDIRNGTASLKTAIKKYSEFLQER